MRYNIYIMMWALEVLARGLLCHVWVKLHIYCTDMKMASMILLHSQEENKWAYLPLLHHLMLNELHISHAHFSIYCNPVVLHHHTDAAPYTVKMCHVTTQTYKTIQLNWIAGYVLHVDSDIVMTEYKSERANKAVNYIYGTIMSRLPKVAGVLMPFTKGNEKKIKLPLAG